MSNDQSTGTAWSWSDRLPWLIIFRAFRPAISGRMLFLGAAGILLMVAGWRFAWVLFGRGEWEGPVAKTLVAQAVERTERNADGDEVIYRDWPAWPWQKDFPGVHPDAGEMPGTKAIPLPRGLSFSGLADHALGSLLTTWNMFTMPFQLVFERGITFRGLAFVSVCGLWALAIWGYIGGAMCRTVALQLTRDERTTWTQVTSHARSKWVSYFSAPLFPLIGVAAAALCVALLGFIAQSNFTLTIAALIWPLALLAGFFMALLLVGLFFGWPLMWGTISTEGTDAFDALSRAYAYVFQRPLHYFFYSLVAAAVGVVGWLFVGAFAEGVNYLAFWAADWFRWTGSMFDVAEHGNPEGLGPVAWMILLFWTNLVRLLAVGFVASFFFSATSAVYLLLRRDVDATEMDEIYLEELEEQYGLPPLAPDAAGSPGVVEETSPEAGEGTTAGGGEEKDEE